MLEKDVAISLRNTHQRITEIMRGKITASNLTFRLFHILNLIKDNPKSNQKFIASKMKLTQGAMSGSIKRLLELKMIEQTPLEEDNRYNVVEITGVGLQVIEDYKDHLDDRYRAMFNNFSEEELKTFNNSLAQINKNLDEISIQDDEEGVIF